MGNDCPGLIFWDTVVYRKLYCKDVYLRTIECLQWSFPKWSRTSVTFYKFRESDISLKHELDSI